MKKLFILLTSIFAVSMLAMAQLKLYVHQNDGSYTEFIAATVDSITFSEQTEETNNDNGYQWVDMGLPSGLLWATCNLGANKPTDFGDYFAYGETQTKESYSPYTYKWFEGTNPFDIIKYGVLSIPDESGFVQTLLELNDDAAHVKLGGNWRMPTIEEFEELIDPEYTNSCLINKNNVKGYLIVSKKNGNTIFLPAAGYKDFNELRYPGEEFYYFTSSITAETLADVEGIGESAGKLEKFFFERTGGGTIRPVLAKTLDYTIRFKANGAEGEMTDIGAKYAETITLPTCTYTKADEQFKGWNTKANGTGISYKENQLVTITEDITLYAMWGSRYGYIDLGLPSGLLWATCNLGAEKPEEYGDYFAWGEVEPKEIYESDNYVGNATGKYTNNQYMELVDDAARHNWGGNWRTPLQEEMEELVNECTWTWTTLNNVNGYEVKGPNGNTIFLPAAGAFYSKPYNQGEGAVYRGNYKRGQTFNLHFGEERVQTMVEMHKYSGFTIRPVRTKTTETYTLTFDANGGDGEMEALNLEYAEYRIVPTSTFIKDGYVSVSWNTKADGSGNAYNFKSQITLKESTTLYAQWEKSVTVSFNPNGGTGVMFDQNIQINTATNLVKNDFIRNGFSFKSWNTKADGTGVTYLNEETITLEEDITLYAQWREITLHNGYEYVDLGLSVKWATCNIGAKTPNEYGGYFAWGETETKDTYNWQNYKWSNGTYNSLTKYCIDSRYGTVDNKTILEIEDDAASQIWGGYWRMPTGDEFDELLTNCDWIWTNVGFEVVSKINGNSIFIPSAEYCAKYWGAENSTYNEAIILYVSERYHEIDTESRYKAELIRPVLP